MICLPPPRAAPHLIPAQALAGSNKGIVDEMIYLEVTRPDCPDLTIVDLPGQLQAARTRWLCRPAGLLGCTQGGQLQQRRQLATAGP